MQVKGTYPSYNYCKGCKPELRQQHMQGPIQGQYSGSVSACSIPPAGAGLPSCTALPARGTGSTPHSVSRGLMSPSTLCGALEESQEVTYVTPYVPKAIQVQLCTLKQVFQALAAQQIYSIICILDTDWIQFQPERNDCMLLNFSVMASHRLSTSTSNKYFKYRRLFLKKNKTYPQLQNSVS